MLGGSEWLIIIIVILVLIGGPNLARELGKLVRGTQKTAENVKSKVDQVKTNIAESVKEVILETADPLRVFVCSMQEETAAERAAIRDSLNQLGKLAGLTRPILFEQIPPSPDNPEKVYREAIERCDVFIIIVSEDISAPVLREYQFAIEYKKPCFFFRKNTQKQSESVKRFLADVTQKWTTYNEPDELASQVVMAIVLDILKNYRQYRLTKSDVVSLLVFYKALNNDELPMELLQAQKENGILETFQKLTPRSEYTINLWYSTKNFDGKEIELLSTKLRKIGYKTSIEPFEDPSRWFFTKNGIIFTDADDLIFINELIVHAGLNNFRLIKYTLRTESSNQTRNRKVLTIQFLDRSIF